jgi:hypothetical protein
MSQAAIFPTLVRRAEPEDSLPETTESKALNGIARLYVHP